MEVDHPAKAHPDLVKALKSKGLKCCHLNVNGLYSKLDEIKLLLYETKVDVLAITETHLSDQIHDYEINIDTYSFVRKDRSRRGNNWGGVIAYYRDHLNIHEVNFNLKSSKTESIWIEISVSSQKLLLACIYRPPDDKDFINYFESIIDKINHRKNFLLLGDLNIDLSDKQRSASSLALRRILFTQNLTNVIKDYTRITPKSKTLIDHAITSNPERIVNCGSFPTCISDYNLIFAIYNLWPKRPPPKLITIQDFKNANIKDLKLDFASVPWNLIDMFDDPDDAAWCWETMFKNTISAHFKTRKVKTRSSSEPWRNNEESS